MRPEKSDEWIDLSFQELEKYALKPIFIVGSPRSGTTLMRTIIDAHPNIFCPPCETFLFETFNKTFNGFIWKDHYEQLPFGRKALIKWFRNFVLDLFGNLAIKTGKTRWAEKTPSHVLVMEFINEVFPDAQFIHMIRNGYDVSKSLKNINWGSRYTLINAWQWVRSVKAGQAFGKKIPSDRYIEIRFEELVDNMEATLKKLCNFLGEEYDDRMINYHLPENNSWGLTFTPFEKQKKAVGRYKELNVVSKFQFRLVAGRLMKQLGYR